MPGEERPATWDDIIRHEASQRGVPAELALAVADTESGFSPTATSPKGAHGIFQLMPDTAKELGVDPADPVQNIRGGIQYLKQQLDAHGGNVEKALQAYNWGPGNAAGGGTPPAETQAYVTKILGRLKPTPTRLPAVTAADMVQNIAKAPPGPTKASAPPEPKSFLKSTVEGMDPRTRTGRRNIAGGVGDLVGTAVGTGVGTLFALPTGGASAAVLPAAGGAAGSFVGGAGEEMFERSIGNAPPDSSLLAAGGEQAAYSVGGRLLAWPIRAAGKRLVASRVGRFAAGHFDEVLTGAREALQHARGIAGDAVTAAKESAASGLATVKEGAAEHLSRVRQFGREVVGETTAKTKAATDAIGSRYEKIATAPPTVTSSVAGRRAQQVISTASQQARAEVGQLVDEAAQSGPDVDIKALKAEAQRILTEELHPSAEAFPRGGATEPSPEVTNLQQLVDKTAGTPARTPTQIADREALHTALAKAQQDDVQTTLKHPAMQVLGRILSAEDTVPFHAAHLFKRELDDAIGTAWDRSVRSRVTNITKVMRGQLREALSQHEPYNIATEAYKEIAPLYTKGLAPKLRRVATEAPEAIVHLIKAKDPTQVKMMRDLLVTMPGKVGRQQEGQFAWDSVRSAWTHQNLIKGSLEKLPERIGKLDPEFREIMYGDGPGSLVLDNLQKISDAYKTATESGAAQVAGAKGRATAGLDEARAINRGAVQATRESGQAGVAAAQKFKKDLVGRSVQDVVEAGAAARKFTKSSIRKAAQGEVLPDVLRATALGPGSIWGALSTVRLLRGPKSADLIQYAAYSPEGTQLLVRALTGPEPGFAMAELLRLSGIGDVAVDGIGTPKKSTRPAPVGPNAGMVGAPPPP